ncbi:MAG: hypothetical protein ACFCU2_01665 [Acidimicrobiia bacterium]
MSVLTAASRRFLGLATVLFLLFTLVPTLGAAGSAEDGGDFEIIIPVSTVVRGPEGSEIVLVQLPTPTDLVGATCEITAMSENQSSVHPDNDLMVSGVLIPDVEGEPGGTVTANDVVVLGPNIVISLLMGPDGVFSAGLTVGFKCTSVAATSTTTTTTTGQTTTTTASSEPITTGSSSTTVLVSGSDVTTTSLETEVKGIQILPLTGRDDTQYMIFGLAVAAAGLLVLLGARSSGDVPLPATTMSMSFMCAHCERGAMFRTPHGLLCRTCPVSSI